MARTLPPSSLEEGTLPTGGGGGDETAPRRENLRCANCLAANCRLLRCSRCKSARYCSTPCQKAHYRVHRRDCSTRRSSRGRRDGDAARNGGVTADRADRDDGDAGAASTTSAVSGEAAVAAVRELHAAVTGLSLDAAWSDMQKATRAAEIVREEEPSERVRTDGEVQSGPVEATSEGSISVLKPYGREPNPLTGTDGVPAFMSSFNEAPHLQSHDGSKESERRNGGPAETADQDVEEEMQRHHVAKEAEVKDSTFTLDLKSKSSKAFSQVVNASTTIDWNYTIEDLVHISCYSVTLFPPRLKQTCDGNDGNVRFDTKYRSMPRPEHLDLMLQPCTDSGLFPNPQGSRDIGFTEVKLVEKRNVGGANGALPQTLLSVVLPRIIQTSARASVTSDIHSVTLRLPYENFDDDGSLVKVTDPSLSSPSLTNLQGVNALCCRSCGHQLIGRVQGDPARSEGTEKAQQPIRRVLPLPMGYWDEISDYLMCYEGDPVVDFSSSSSTAVEGVVFEDSGVFLLHQEDLGMNVSVLAIEGYGENTESDPKECIQSLDGLRNVDIDGNTASNNPPNGQVTAGSPSNDAGNKQPPDGVLYRGERSWRDGCGGATVCCSQCCSTLGFASVESLGTMRLYKHRLRTGSSAATLYQRNTCGSFLAREMVRYAESQAVFTFVATMHEKRVNVPGKRHATVRRNCLLLRLVSWDTFLCTGQGDGCDDGASTFEKAAKVIFEETEEDAILGDAQSSIAWAWDVDLCCPPGKNDEDMSKNDAAIDSPNEGSHLVAKKASVRIHLSEDEWTELRQTLINGSAHFSKTTSDATVLLRLGRSNVGNSALTSLSLLE